MYHRGLVMVDDQAEDVQSTLIVLALNPEGCQ